jgi:hypothetical protein
MPSRRFCGATDKPSLHGFEAQTKNHRGDFEAQIIKL